MSISFTGLVWLIVVICVVYDFIKAFVYIGCNKLTRYLEQKRTERLKEAIKKHLENQQ